MFFKRIFFGLIIAACAATAFGFTAYEDVIEKITRQLTNWATQKPVEKVYLQLDKPYYAAGDDIWFKAYVTHGSNNQLAPDSGVLNVELIDAKDAIKQRLKLAVKNGVANGDFALPDTLQQGNYRIRAYTNYMRNAGSEYFFDKTLSIINAIRGNGAIANNVAGAANAVSAAQKADVQFFPEGGSLVNGVPTKIAFKAVAPNGLGLDFTGIVTDSKGLQVASFASTHLGMGVFNFTPVTGNTYQARITLPDGSSSTVVLPNASDKGYVLNISTDAQNILVKIAADRLTTNEDANRQVVLVAQSGGKIYYTAKTKLGTVSIPKAKFPAGIMQFTLFTAGGKPLNERLVFARDADVLNLTITTDQQTYAPRQRVKIGLDAKSNNGSAVAGNFSVAVIDETKVPVNEANENNILAGLLLSSDIKGYIEQPAYYFNNASDKTRADLDVLMLTQGYHRFEWRDVLNDKIAADAYEPENALTVMGTVSTPSGKPVPNGKVKLINFDDINYSYETVTDADGKFAFGNLSFADSVRFIVQATNAKNKRDVVINLDSIAPANTAANKNRADFEITTADAPAEYAQSSKALYSEQLRYGVGNHVLSLREVIIREKKQALKYSSNLNGAGNADQVLLARDLRNMACIYLSDCLQGRLVGVIFRNGVPYSTRSFRPMQVIIDGVYVESSYLNNINFYDVQAIEVLRGIGTAAIYGGRASNGVIIVTTKRGGENEYDGPITGRGIKAYYPKGYLKARAFYSPQYDKSGVNKQLADLRTTIYWNPNVITRDDGKASFEYFNAGSPGTYRVVVEGIDANGNPGRKVFRYQVR
ncbi:TonB-dependent receptor [Inquilinus sp. KBS0705]|nr:TonB-dependent receptor [Inquilinus sp. KBS0705]